MFPISSPQWDFQISWKDNKLIERVTNDRNYVMGKNT